MWYPGIDTHVEPVVRHCLFCQGTESDKRSYEPLKPASMPADPWQSVVGDFYGPMDNGKYCLVCQRVSLFEMV